MRVVGIVTLCGCLLAVCAATSNGHSETRTYDIPGSAAVAIAWADHAAWVADAEELGFVGHIDKISDKGIERIPIGPHVSTQGVAAVANSIWFTAAADDEEHRDFIGVLTDDGRLRRYAIPTRDSQPSSIVSDNKGDVFFSEQNGNAIGEIRNGKLTEHRLPGGLIRDRNGPTSLAIADNAPRVWFIDARHGELAALRPDGSFLSHEVGTRGLTAIAASKGHLLWLADGDGAQLARIDLQDSTWRIHWIHIPWPKAIPNSLAAYGSNVCMGLDHAPFIGCYGSNAFYKLLVVNGDSAAVVDFDRKGHLWYAVWGVDFPIALRGSRVVNVPMEK